MRAARPDVLRSKIILYKSGHSIFLGIICKVKENALCGDHINPSVCDQGSGPKPMDRFPSNFIWEIFTE